MTTPTTQPSEEARLAAVSVLVGLKALVAISDEASPGIEHGIARIIDTHLAPLCERAERAETKVNSTIELLRETGKYPLLLQELEGGP